MSKCVLYCRCINPSAIGCWRAVRFLVLFHQNLTGERKKKKQSVNIWSFHQLTHVLWTSSNLKTAHAASGQMTEATTLVTSQLNHYSSIVRKNGSWKPLVIFRSDHLDFLLSVSSWLHQCSEIEPSRWFLEMGERDHHHPPRNARARRTDKLCADADTDRDEYYHCTRPEALA